MAHSGKRYQYAIPEVRTREIAVTQTHKVPLSLPKANKLRVLITGGAGFVGSHLVDRLLERGDSVIVVAGGGSVRTTTRCQVRLSSNGSTGFD